MPYPDHFSIRLYDDAQGRDDGPEPEYNGPDRDDLAALKRAHAAFAIAIAAMTGHAWTYDFVSTCTHADLLTDARANFRMLGDAIAEAEAIMRDGGVL